MFSISSWSNNIRFTSRVMQTVRTAGAFISLFIFAAMLVVQQADALDVINASYLVKDINPTSDHAPGSNPRVIENISLNGITFFSASTPREGTELWRTRAETRRQ